jgi:SAM-dependent methyltransferase
MDKNQQDHWIKKHKTGIISNFADNPYPLAIESCKYISKPAKVLDLGCGAGNDAKYFAEQGFEVIATDFIPIVIEENEERYKDIPNLKFEVLDTKGLSDFAHSDFDLIYARLSIQYFTDAETKSIFKAIQDKLKTGGLFAFLCKSINDPMYGQGELVEENMYSWDGQVRHFFSEEYAKECLANDFKIITLESGDEILYGKKSSYVKVISKKK